MAPLSSTLLANPAAEAFASATLSIVEESPLKRLQKLHWNSSPLSRISTGDGDDGDCAPRDVHKVHKTRAYYRDSSGRARVHLRVRLTIPNDGGEGDDESRVEGGLEALLECGCIHPAPVESAATAQSSSSDAAGTNEEKVGEEKEDEKDKANNQEDEDDEMWKNELSTIGKEDMKGGSKLSPWFTDTTCTFECTIANSNSSSNNSGKHTPSSSSWALEGVTILHSEIERSTSSENSNAKKSSKAPISALLFDIEVAVRGNGILRTDTLKEMLEEGELELCAVLRQKTKYRSDTTGEESGNNKQGGTTSTSSSVAAKSLLGGGREGAGIAAGLLGLEYGGGSLSPSIISRGLGSTTSGTKQTTAQRNAVQYHYGTKILRTTPPLLIHATLVPPLQLTVREVCGARAASGSTLVEITVEHSSRWHGEDVTVTGIAFHPGQSRLWEDGDDAGEADSDAPNAMSNNSSSNTNNVVSEGKSMQGGELSVLDMSRRVRWGFAPGSAPELPLVLGPYEAFATVIQVDAGEDVRSRAFLSPISVNAMIGGVNNASGTTNKDEKETQEGERVMVTADARWTSSRVGVENSDAFRVDMSLRGGLETACRVGAPLVVSLRVLNLSMEPRDLMLLMAKDGEGRGTGLRWERPLDGRRRRRVGRRDSDGVGGGGNHREQQLLHQHGNAGHQAAKDNHGFNTAVVSEVNGYTFGVWGLSGDDDGTTRHHRDHELLAVDAALLLGEVKGQHSIEAELRFVPLREGTLDVPNLKLYDKRGMRWYNCVHTLKIVARQGNV